MVPARAVKRGHRMPLLLACALVTAACQRQPPQAGPVATEAARASQDRFERDTRAWRERRRSELLAPEGWTSLVGLHWIGPGEHYVGSAPGNGIRIAAGPPELGLLTLRRDRTLRLVPATQAGLALDGAPLRAPVVLRTDQDEGGASELRFDDGKGVATVIRRGERFALRVRHADAPTRTGFGRIDYWPADPGWSVAARFVPHPPGRTLRIANIVGTIDRVHNPGALEFERDGRTHRIEALDEGGDGLFLVFADRSNGHGSYAAGRFLDAARPGAGGRVVLDFNRSYNPPCAFTAFATCPLPPPENRLDLAITAGEKAYHVPP